DLVGRRAVCDVRADAGSPADCDRQARAIRRDLLRGRWRLDRGAFLAYLALTEAWLQDKAVVPADRVALAEEAMIFAASPLGAPAAKLSASESGLPWTLLAGDMAPAETNRQLLERERLMAGGISILVVLVLAGSAFIVRAVSRELAVARLQADFVSAVSHEFR